ncbi:hypothetical protein Tco_0389558 [Tanacetum coccineum]
MARRCTHLKRPRNSARFKEKILLVQVQESGQVLDDEQLAFLADPQELQNAKITLINHETHIAAFQTDVLMLIDSTVMKHKVPRPFLMANPFCYESGHFLRDIEITSDSTIISYDQYLKENKIAKCNAESLINENVNETLTVELERYKERVKMFEERQKVDLNSHENYIDSQMNDMILNRNAMFAAFQKEIDTLKLTLSKNVKENESLITVIKALKKQTKEREDKYIEEAIDLEK